jgi:general secretion pathway protein A
MNLVGETGPEIGKHAPQQASLPSVSRASPTMYTSFFGLSEKPFAITPNPRYLYMSERHAEALAHLMYGLNEAGGFIQLTGEVGTGKTTVVRTLLEQLPQHADVAVILNPRMTPAELLHSICQELGIFLSDENPDSIKDMVDVLNGRLLTAHAKGRRVVIIIDEAQNLLPETLEQVRLLTNLETATHKLMQIILIGQPELRELLDRSDLRQLAQRITGRYHLAPLSRDDTAAYVRHRLKVAGASRAIFTDRALREAHRLSHGVPRLINIICDRALLGAYTQEQHEVDVQLLRKAAAEVAGKWRIHPWWQWAALSAAAVVILCGVLAFAWWRPSSASKHTAAVVATPVVVTPPKPPPEPVPMDAAQVFTQYPNDIGTDAAFAALFALWGAPFQANGRACDQATAHGLECVFQKGSWGLLRSLNRPAILQLSDDQGVAHQAVVAAVDAVSAHLMLGGKLQQVSLASLSRYWNGDFLLLWRPKVSGQRALVVGVRGKEVYWLRSSLAKLLGNDLPARSNNVFDQDLSAQLADFQRAHRLNADGIAGLQTQIALDAAVSDDGSPSLSGATLTATTAAGNPT